MSSYLSITEDRTPSKYNAVFAINRKFIHIMERWDSHMQVIMDDAQMKRRGVSKIIGRRGRNRLFMDNRLTQFNLMVRWKVT